MPKSAPKKSAKKITLPKKMPTGKEREEFFAILQKRFEDNMQRHMGLQWNAVLERLEAKPKKILTLYVMETTGGEPDVVGRDKKTGEFTFVDCSPESPSGRRSICYDGKARKERKKFPPQSSAVEIAKAMGVELLTEEQYRELQALGDFDLRTSSWILTPLNIRELGGALFADRRYGDVFVYHNGADSYYGARGFRGALKV